MLNFFFTAMNFDSQMWLNCLIGNHHFSYITKFRLKNLIKESTWSLVLVVSKSTSSGTPHYERNFWKKNEIHYSSIQNYIQTLLKLFWGGKKKKFPYSSIPSKSMPKRFPPFWGK
jgi:hypothetical protein